MGDSDVVLAYLYILGCERFNISDFGCTRLVPIVDVFINTRCTSRCSRVVCIIPIAPKSTITGVFDWACCGWRSCAYVSASEVQRKHSTVAYIWGVYEQCRAI